MALMNTDQKKSGSSFSIRVHLRHLWLVCSVRLFLGGLGVYFIFQHEVVS
jgi:hypothetical protein